MGSWASCLRRGIKFVLDHVEAAAEKSAVEIGDRPGGGDGQQSAFLQRPMDRGEPSRLLEKEALSGVKGRSVCVQKYRMQRAFGLMEKGRVCRIHPFNPGIVGEHTIGEKPALPVDEAFRRFCDRKMAALLGKLRGHRLQKFSEAEADDVNLRLPCGAEGSAGQPREFGATGGHGRTSDL